MSGVVMYNRAGIQTHDVRNAAFVVIEDEDGVIGFQRNAELSGVHWWGIHTPGKYIKGASEYDDWGTFEDLTELYSTALSIF